VSNDKAKLIDRVRKILARTQSNNANEAAAAVALAAKLMHEHALSETDVTAEVGDPGDAVTEVVVGSEGFMAPWRFALVSEIARAFFCEAIALRRGETRRIRIIGRKDDADVATMVFRHLAKELQRLADEDVKNQDVSYSLHLDDLVNFERATMAGSGPSVASVENYKDNFLRGAVVAIAWRLKNEFEEFTRSSEKALVLVERRREEAGRYRNAKYTESRVLGAEDAMMNQNADELAIARGYVAGLEVRIPGKETPGQDEQKKLEGGKKP